ncbi:hypothetical protein T4C_13582, partial [Trichinella pseudospiralis]
MKDDAVRLEIARAQETKPCEQQNEGSPVESTVQPVVEAEASGAQDEMKDDAVRLEIA